MITVLLLGRGGAGAGGAATLALKRLPAGAQRVPTAQTAAAQVPLQHHVRSHRRHTKDKDERKCKDESQTCSKPLTFNPVTLAHRHIISETPSGHCGLRRTMFLSVPYDTDLALCTQR